MNEYLFESREELKRLEHLIHVTLKYTRTVDVILNTLNRLINTFDFIIEGLLDNAKDKNLLSFVPKSPSLKSDLLIKTYPDNPDFFKFISFYHFLREVANTSHTKREEYRRHVTLITEMKNKTAEIDIDTLETFEKIAFQFFNYAQDFIEGKKVEVDD